MRWIQRRSPPFDLIPADQYVEESPTSGIRVVGDMPDVLSPVTGEILHGRRGYREHMKQHGLGHADDYKETWKKAEEHRQEMADGTSKSHSREIRRDVVETMRKLGVL